MKKIKQQISLSLFIVLLSFGANSQMVKFIKNPLQAKYRVFISNTPKGATHWIYRVARPADIRKPGEWYIVPNPQLFKNAMTLFEVKDRNEADLIVYYVSKRDSAKILLR
jgi:hypothetical protein